MLLLGELRQLGLQPNVITSNPCGHLHCCDRRWSGLAAPGYVQQQGLQPNVIPYVAVIIAGGQTWRLFHELQQQGLQPSLVAYVPRSGRAARASY